MFITLEGPDGSGKTTQAELLIKYIESLGLKAIKTREPGGTLIGKKIREIILAPESEEMCGMAEVLLYAADRTQHVEEVIKPALLRGDIVVCDRYFDSSVAYQGGLGISSDVIHKVNEVATCGIMPDVTLLLDCDPECGLTRAKKTSCGDRIEQRHIEFHKKVREKYIELAEIYHERYRVISINDKSIDEIHQEIVDIVEKELLKVGE